MDKRTDSGEFYPGGDRRGGDPIDLTFDDAVTRTSARAVKSSGIWAAIWGALAALPAGVASLYDWCVAQLAGKLSTSGGTMTGRISALLASLKWGTDPTFARFTIPGATNEHYMCFGYKDGNFGLFVKNGSGSAERFYALPSSGGDIAMIQDLAGKADSADLRYRIAEAGYATTGARLPEGVTVWVNEAKITEYYLDFISGEWIFSLEGYAAVWDEDGSFLRKDNEVVFKDSEDTVLPTPPDLIVPRTLADRAVNLITATDETSIDIELPAAVTVDGVRYCRDFILDIDNSANAGDLALEFTALDVDYAFVPLEDDSISEMMTIGAGERVRLYFTETPYTATGSLPVINVARVTLGDFVTSTTTQGGN